MDYGPETADSGQRCFHCPAPENLRCAGFDVHRFCELIDPECPQYHPGYREVIVRETRHPGEDADGRLAPYHQPGFGNPMIEGAEMIGISTNCCGGGMPPGIFD
jgi:hypothetical protein